LKHATKSKGQKRFEPAKAVTMKDIAREALDIAELLVESQWGDREFVEQVEKRVSGLLNIWSGFPNRPAKGQRMTLTWRLARAEAEKMFGRCRLMEEALTRREQRRPEDFPREGLKLFAAINAFIIMAQGL